MDTKTLYDLALENNISFTEDGYHDMHDIVVEYLLSNKDYLLDYAPDWLAEGKDIYIDRMADHCKRATERFKQAESYARKHSTGLVSCMMTSYAYSLGELGEAFYLVMKEGVEKTVETHLEEWWNDVCAYEYEMQESGKEDYYDGLAEERRLGMD